MKKSVWFVGVVLFFCFFFHAKEVQAVEVTLGASNLSTNYIEGDSGQGIVEATYSYVPLLSLSLESKPVMLIQLPEELAAELNGDVGKRQLFLSSLKGQITVPSTLIFNQTYDLENLPSTISVSYDFGVSSLVVKFPEKFLNLSLLSKWQTTIQFDAKELYEKGIEIPAANNGENYLISGSFVDNFTGFQLIELLTFNKKQGIIDTPLMKTGF